MSFTGTGSYLDINLSLSLPQSAGATHAGCNISMFLFMSSSLLHFPSPSTGSSLTRALLVSLSQHPAERPLRHTRVTHSCLTDMRQQHRQASWIGIPLLLMMTLLCGGTKAVPPGAKHQRSSPELGSHTAEDTELPKDLWVPVTVGQAAILPCDLPPPPSSSSPLDLRVYWQIADSSKVVHFYQKGQEEFQHQDPAYSNRTRLFTDQLQAGNYSLQLRNVSEHDNHTFECVVCHDNLKCPRKKIAVRVQERQDGKQENSTTEESQKSTTVPIVVPFVGVAITIGILGVCRWRKNKRAMRENQDAENGVAVDDQHQTNETATTPQHQQNGPSAMVSQLQQNGSALTTQHLENGSVEMTQHLKNGPAKMTQHLDNGPAEEKKHMENGSAMVTQHQVDGSAVVTQPKLQQQSGSAASTEAPEDEPLLRNGGQEDLHGQNSPDKVLGESK